MVTITDHAVLRWLQYQYGIDIEHHREEIASIPGLAEAAKAGARKFSSGGFTIPIVDGGIVPTILPAPSPGASVIRDRQYNRGVSPKITDVSGNKGRRAVGTRKSGGRRVRRPLPELDLEEE
jgi:hypothetical protein